METQHGILRPLNSFEIDKILEQNAIGHLACSQRGELYVVPVTYAKEGDFIYAHSRPGKKVDFMRSNPSVCFSVEEIENIFKWKSVIAWGTFEELEGMEAARGMRLLIKKIVSLGSEEEMSSLQTDAAAYLADAIIYRLRMNRVTGRSEGF